MNGTLTIESGNNKAIMAFTEKESGDVDIKINFNPAIVVKRDKMTANELFVNNLVVLICDAVQG